MKVETAAERVDNALADIAQRNRTLEAIPPEELGDRGAAKGEVLTVDYVGRIDGTEFPGGAGQGIEVEIGGTGFIPGFSEPLEGMKPGETRTIEVTFPAEYGVPTLAGKAASFEVTAHALNRAVVPALDDELAKKLGFDDLAAMREMVTSRIQAEYDQLARLRLKRQLLDALADVAKFAAPEAMVEQEFAQIWQRLETERQAGRLDEDDKDKDEETLKADYRAIAERRVRLGLLLGEVGRANSITVATGRDGPGDPDGGDALPGPAAAGVRVLPAEPARRRDPARPAVRGEGDRLHPGARQGRGEDGHAGGTGRTADPWRTAGHRMDRRQHRRSAPEAQRDSGCRCNGLRGRVRALRRPTSRRRFRADSAVWPVGVRTGSAYL